MGETLLTFELETKIGLVRLASSDKGLAFVALPRSRGRGLAGWIDRHAHGAQLRPNARANASAAKQLIEYLEGDRVSFELPLDLRGTDFQRRAFEQIAAIPYGHTRSYGELAEALGNANSHRAVGAAAGSNPLPLVVPCHRVVGADGHLAGYIGGRTLQAKLLAMESGRAESTGRLF